MYEEWTRTDHIMGLVYKYWDAAWKEGNENRKEDTPDGKAGKTLLAIEKEVEDLEAELDAIKAENIANLGLANDAARGLGVECDGDLGFEAGKIREERDMLKAENKWLRGALERCARNDKTTYEHHEPRPDGTRPKESGGTIFLTPREIASAALSKGKDFPPA